MDYALAESVRTKEEADALITEAVAELMAMTGPIVPLKPAEADRIARKNAVAHIARTRPDLLAQAEILFDCRSPFK